MIICFWIDALSISADWNVQYFIFFSCGMPFQSLYLSEATISADIEISISGSPIAPPYCLFSTAFGRFIRIKIRLR